MAESYQVETHDIAISDALMEIAAKNGWKINFDHTANQQHHLWLVIYPGKGPGGLRYVTWNVEKISVHQTLTVPEAVELLKADPPPPPICVGGRPLDVQAGGILISLIAGDLFIDTATINEIHKQLHRDDEVEGKHLELRSNPQVEMWLQKTGDHIDLMTTSPGKGNYFLLEFRSNGRVHHQRSIPKSFGFNLTAHQTLAIKD